MKNNLLKAIDVLKSGGIVMHPTETCYGLAVDIFNEDALKKLYKVKGMDESKPLSILVENLAMAEEYGVFNDKARDLAARFWPGALSIIVPRKRNLPEFFNKGHETVSFRVSSDPFAGRLAGELGGPVTTTSANKAGEPAMYSVGDFDGVDFVVDGGEITKNEPSTIVKVEGEDLIVLRQGAVLAE